MVDRTRCLVLGGLASVGMVCGMRVQAATENAHDFTFTSIDGEPLPLSSFDGKVLMIVNTASQCGFTRQYAGLQSLWEHYRDQGFVMVGVPSNDFGGQEPGSEAEIKNFCEVNFDIDFPLTEKQHVMGEKAHPFYAWARSVLGDGNAPRWNFHKYLVARNGTLAGAFTTSVAPELPDLAAAIESLLNRSVS